jgi:hypothetical protein
MKSLVGYKGVTPRATAEETQKKKARKSLTTKGGQLRNFN